jgi:lipid A ethanolaminephosphotransferase
MSFFKKPSLSHSTLIILVSLFFASVGNIAFFKHVLEIYPLSWEMAPFLASLCIVLVAVTVVVMELLSWRSATKGVLILIVILSALVAYFMDSYNAVIDIQMLDNAIQTDIKE